MPWNNSSILPPPVNMFLCNKKVDISALKHVCNNITKVLSKQSPLHKESALCSRFLYKYDKKFSNDIGYRNFRKVHVALKKYLALNLLKDIESFISALPSEKDDEKYLPTRQMLEYVMLRIITFSMIMLRICICSKQSAIFYLNRLKRGESHWMSLLPYALLSRLWSMSMVLVQHSTSWYANLYPYLNILEFKGLPFLPEHYELPQDLEKWLDLKNVDNFGRFNWDQRRIDVENNLLDDDDEHALFDNILSFVNQLNQNEIEEDLEEGFKPLLEKCRNELNRTRTITAVDYGEVLPRDSFTINKGEVITRESFKMDQGEALSRESYKMNEGEALSRESFKVLLNTKKKGGNKNKVHEEIKSEKKDPNVILNYTDSIDKHKTIIGNPKHSPMNITNSVSLMDFIKTEEKFRNESISRALTAHLSLMQWHALKNALLKLCDVLNNRKIERKFKKIWKEKCLDCK